MIIKTVSVHYGRKQNLGDYCSADVQCTVWADVDEEEQADLDQLMRDLWAMAKENVKAQVEPVAAAYGKGSGEMREYFMGLPVKYVEEE